MSSLDTAKQFVDWDLPEEIQAALTAKGWTSPTPIQLDTIPLAREGRDVVGQARTGSGKTAAFGIPIIERATASGVVQALVLCPTRELATQVAEELNWLQGDKGLKLLTVYGGTDIEKQAKQLDAGVDIIVGTPGRVIDMSKRGHIDLESITLFALDEADRMLDMGFFPDILWCLERLENREQTLLFSATFPQEVLEAVNTFIEDAEHIMSDDLDVEVPEIDQYQVKVGRANKLWVLGRLLVHMDKEDQMIIFCNTKRMVDLLVERLERHRFSAVGIHGDMAQNKRERIISDFREGHSKVIIATDVAARGLDVDGITCVVNYDLPIDTESYVHRIGRTGRMGRKGEAWSFIAGEDGPQMNKIASTWNMVVPEVEAPALPEGMDRDPVRRQTDWSEKSDVFGMVPVRMSAGADLSRLAIHEFIVEAGRVPDLAVGEIRIDENGCTFEIHREKVQNVIDAIKGKELGGQPTKARLA